MSVTISCLVGSIVLCAVSDKLFVLWSIRQELGLHKLNTIVEFDHWWYNVVVLLFKVWLKKSVTVQTPSIDRRQNRRSIAPDLTTVILIKYAGHRDADT